MSQQYNSLKGNPARAKFREEWLKKEVTSIIESFSETRMLTDEDIKETEWLTYPQIVVEEGGVLQPEAIKNARTYVCKCLIMGTEFFQFCSMRGTTVYAYIKIKSRNTFTKCWAKRTDG